MKAFCRIFILILSTTWYCEAQHAVLEVVASSTASPFLLQINNTLINETPQSTYRVTELPLEIYGVSIRPDEVSEHQQLVYLRVGDTTRYCFTPNTTPVLKKCPTNFPRQEWTEVAFKETGDTIIQDIVLVEKPIVSAIVEKEANSNEKALADGFEKVESKKPEKIEAETPQPTRQEEVLSPKQPAKSILNPVCVVNLDGKHLKNIKQRLKNASSPEKQLAISQEELKNTCLYMKDVKELMKIVEEDEIKVDIFKELYPQIRDPERVGMIYDTFLFDFSIDDIKNFIHEQKP